MPNTCALAHSARVERAHLNGNTKCTRRVYRQRHTVRAARASYVEAWRVITAARTIQTMRNTLAVQCTVQVHGRTCGTASDMLSARAPEREGFG